MKTRHLHRGDILPHIIFLSWPVIAANGIQSLLSMFDIMWIGKLGVSALSALAICGPLLSVFWAVESGFLVATVAIISRYCGEKKYRLIGRATVNLAGVGLAFSVVFAFIMSASAVPLLSFFGAKGDTLVFATSYFRIMCFSAISVGVLYILMAVIRGAGDARAAFYSLLVAQAGFLVLEPLLIFGKLGLPKLGINGGAVAYTIAYSVSAAIVVWVFATGRRKHLLVKPADFVPDFRLITKYLKIAMPVMLQSIAINIAAMAMVKICSRFGDSMMGAIGIAGRLDMFSSMVGIAVGNGVSVMVGHNIGARQEERAKKSVTEGIRFFWLIAIPISAVYIIFAPYILKIFTQDAQVLKYGTMALRTVPFVYALSCVWLMTSAAFQGSGATRISMIISMAAYLLVQVPFAFFLSKIPGVGERGIFIAIALAQAFMGAAGWFMYKRGGWIKG